MIWVDTRWTGERLEGTCRRQAGLGIRELVAYAGSLELTEDFFSGFSVQIPEVGTYRSSARSETSRRRG